MALSERMLLAQLQLWLEDHMDEFKFMENIAPDEVDKLFHKKSADGITIAEILWPAISGTNTDCDFKKFCIPSKQALMEFREVFKIMLHSFNLPVADIEFPVVTSRE